MSVIRQEAPATASLSSSIQMMSLSSDRSVTSSRASTETSVMVGDWFTAVAHNDLRAVTYLLSRGADANMRCPVTALN